MFFYLIYIYIYICIYIYIYIYIYLYTHIYIEGPRTKLPFFYLCTSGDELGGYRTKGEQKRVGGACALNMVSNSADGQSLSGRF